MRLAFALLGAVLIACCSCSRSSGGGSANADSTQSAERATLENQVAARFDSTRARLDSLRSDAVAAGDKLDAAMKSKIDALVAQKDSAGVQFEKLQRTEQGKWNDVRAGVATLLDSLDVRIGRARHDLRRHA